MHTIYNTDIRHNVFTLNLCLNECNYKTGTSDITAPFLCFTYHSSCYLFISFRQPNPGYNKNIYTICNDITLVTPTLSVTRNKTGTSLIIDLVNCLGFRNYSNI